ncbi:MAG TPA: virulence RhuM family protein [Candidatus Cloacimonetes bacterium]|nr:virulence RhuM family protein [Candidatus Cloacimonadota bacterium]
MSKIVNGDMTISGNGKVILYTTKDQRHQLDVVLDGDTAWLSQKQIAELYQVAANTVSHHINQIYRDGELAREATVRHYRVTQNESNREVTRPIEFYNLEMILAIGYRVRSPRGVEFRQWATERLQEYIVKGFTLDDERLKGNNPLTDHFDELLARVRDIRASEQRVYLRLKDIFSLAEDYRPDDQDVKVFFATMQNKMHFAATGKTAAQIVAERANAGEPNMGLTSWKGQEIRKADVTIAKNYLNLREIDILNRIVVMFLDHAELKIIQRELIYTKEWEDILDKFLASNEVLVLEGAGKVSHNAARQIAETEYDSFAQKRRAAKEKEAESRYLDDLQNTVKLVENKRKKR